MRPLSLAAFPPDFPAIVPPTPVAEREQVFWHGDTLWHLRGDIRDRLLHAEGLRLEQWRADGAATLVKSGAGRTIYHVRLPGLELYVKHFRAVGTLSLLHQFVRESRAEKEFTLARRLRAGGVNTIRPLALGQRWHNRLLAESYLVTEAIPNGLTLFELIDRWLLPGRMASTAERRREIAVGLARLVARVHELGVEHRDLHERNIIAQPQTGGEFDFFLLDLHELRTGGPLDWPTTRRELSRMGRYFTLRTSAADRLRFFQEYARLRGIPPARIGELACEAESATVLSRARFWRRRDTRTGAKNLRLACYRGGGVVAHAVQELPEPVVRDLMADPNEPFRHVERWWKIGRMTRVAEVAMPAVRQGEPLLYKQFYFKGWHESFGALFRRNQATRAWHNGHALLLRELPTPRPLALLHVMRFGMPATSYLVTERVPGAVPLHRHLDRAMEEADPADRPRIVRGVTKAAARLLRALHDRGVSHRDLKASNILAEPAGDPAHPKLWVIDLDGVQTWQRIPECHRVQNLARFCVSFHASPWVSRADRLRFLEEYLGRGFHDRPAWKALWRELARHADAKIRRNLRKGRGVV